MYSRLHLATKYLNYCLTASNGKGHGVHSPFVFDFIKNILNDRRSFYAYEHLESFREQLLRDETVIELDDFGAGSVTGKGNRRTVASIARFAGVSKKFGQLLFRIVQYYQPHYIIELGTSLGLSTAYMAMANSKARIITIEGSGSVGAAAMRNYDLLQIHNTEVVIGNFDNKLHEAIDKLHQIDLAFIDGNHRREPTLRYFEQLLAKSTPQSIFIFDDIHWSDDMEKAWQDIIEHPKVTCSISLFFMGIAFFRPEFKTRQHFTIRF